MTVLLVGGGTGGHITPLLAVAHDLKHNDKSTRVVYIGERGSKFGALTKDSTDIDEKYGVSAGKFRRYHGDSFLTKLLDIKTNLQNIADFFRVIGGFFQAVGILRKTRPDIAFIKGGFVGVPVGLACALKKVPYVTHDSDTLPGLANRIIGKWAAFHAVGMPEEFYSYPKAKMAFVGIPLGEEWQPVDDSMRASYRSKLDLPKDSQVVCITGGSLGAVRLNNGIEPAMANLIKNKPNLYVLHQTGKTKDELYADLSKELRHRIKTLEFIDDLQVYTGAADLVIARAGATTIAELAAQHKALVLVPNPQLTGGHQLKNAEHLKELGAAEIINEEDLIHNTNQVVEQISGLLRSDEHRKELGRKIGTLSKMNATAEITKIIQQLAKKDK